MVAGLILAPVDPGPPVPDHSYAGIRASLDFWPKRGCRADGNYASRKARSRHRPSRHRHQCRRSIRRHCGDPQTRQTYLRLSPLRTSSKRDPRVTASRFRRGGRRRPPDSRSDGGATFFYFTYSESFFNSSGMGGNGGHSCEYPLSSGVATSDRSVPSCTANLCAWPAEYPSHRHTAA
jgi:hypothetical protein